MLLCYRNFEVAVEESLPQPIRDCVNMLTSDAMFLILSNVTGLKLHPLAAGSDDESEDDSMASEPKPKKTKPSVSDPSAGMSHYLTTALITSLR